MPRPLFNNRYFLRLEKTYMLDPFLRNFRKGIWFNRLRKMQPDFEY